MPAIPPEHKAFCDRFFIETPSDRWTFSAFTNHFDRAPNTLSVPLKYAYQACLIAIAHRHPPFNTAFDSLTPQARDKAFVKATSLLRATRTATKNQRREKRKHHFMMNPEINPTISMGNVSSGNIETRIELSGHGVVEGDVNVNVAPVSRESEEPSSPLGRILHRRKRRRRDRSASATENPNEEDQPNAQDLPSTPDMPGPSNRTLFPPNPAQPAPAGLANQLDNGAAQTEAGGGGRRGQLSDALAHGNAEYDDSDSDYTDDDDDQEHTDGGQPANPGQPENPGQPANPAESRVDTPPAPALPAVQANLGPNDIPLTDPARSLIHEVRRYVGSFNQEQTQANAHFIALAGKNMFFPSSEGNPLRSVLAMTDINLLLDMIPALPEPSAVFVATLGERERLMAADADFWDFPGYPKDAVLSKKDRDVWLYVDTVMRYLARFLSTIRERQANHTEGWFDANVWSPIADHAFLSSQELRLERKEITSMVDEAHVSVTHITPREPAPAVGDGPPPPYRRTPKYDGVVHTLPATAPHRFDLAFVEVKSFASRNRHPHRDRHKVLRAMRRSLMIIRVLVSNHLKQTLACDELHAKVNAIMAKVVVVGIVCQGLGITILRAVNPVGKIILVKEWSGEVTRGKVGLVVDATWRAKLMLEQTAAHLSEVFKPTVRAT